MIQTTFGRGSGLAKDEGKTRLSNNRAIIRRMYTESQAYLIEEDIVIVTNRLVTSHDRSAQHSHNETGAVAVR